MTKEIKITVNMLNPSIIEIDAKGFIGKTCQIPLEEITKLLDGEVISKKSKEKKVIQHNTVKA